MPPNFYEASPSDASKASASPAASDPESVIGVSQPLKLPPVMEHDHAPPEHRQSQFVPVPVQPSSASTTQLAALDESQVPVGRVLASMAMTLSQACGVLASTAPPSNVESEDDELEHAPAIADTATTKAAIANPLIFRARYEIFSMLTICLMAEPLGILRLSARRGTSDRVTRRPPWQRTTKLKRIS